jgi:hypothetical protein
MIINYLLRADGKLEEVSREDDGDEGVKVRLDMEMAFDAEWLREIYA